MRNRLKRRGGALLSAWLLVGLGATAEGNFATANAATSSWRDMVFKKVEVRTTFGSARQGDGGSLAVNSQSIRFISKQGTPHFSVPSRAVTDLFYSRVSGRRIKTAVVVSPLLLLSKGKKHYLTISFNDGKGLAGAVEFRLDKSNYRGVLRAVESVSNVTAAFDQEGIKDEKETLARRGASGDPGEVGSQSLEFSSLPEGAEIEIDGVFIGTTPRTKNVNAGQHRIKISKAGFKTWERTVEIDPHETIPLRVELEPQ